MSWLPAIAWNSPGRKLLILARQRHEPPPVLEHGVEVADLPPQPDAAVQLACMVQTLLMFRLGSHRPPKSSVLRNLILMAM